MSQETEEQITVDYNGNLSNRMIWEEDKLRQFVRLSDLRSSVLIRDGAVTSRTGIENLGEVIAWKRLLDPNLLLPSRRKESELEIASQYPFPKYVININHHILTERVRNQRDGRFDEELFAKQFNSLVRVGLGAVLAQEKTTTFIGSTLIGGFLGGMTAAVGLPGFYFSKEGIHNFVTSFPRNSFEPLQDIVALGQIYLGGALLFITAIGILTFKELDEDLKSNDPTLHSFKPYFNSVWDLNPIKHLGGYLRGNLYLTTRGRELVSIQ